MTPAYGMVPACELLPGDLILIAERPGAEQRWVYVLKVEDSNYGSGLSVVHFFGEAKPLLIGAMSVVSARRQGVTYYGTELEP